MSIIRQLARVANKIDSASTGTFLSKGDSTGDFTTVNYTDLSGRPTTLDSAALTTIVDSAYIQARQTGGGAAGLDSAAITALVDSNYVVARSPSASSGFAQYEYTATAGQTTFQDSDINGNVMSYTADGIFVFYNGVLIAPTTDYTATDGSSVVLTTGADSGSHVAISKWSVSAPPAPTGPHFGDRAVIGGGGTSSSQYNYIDYFDITSTGNASDFGDLTVVKTVFSAVSDATYGVFGAGINAFTTMDYVTIATTGNATDFGDCSPQQSSQGSVSNGYRGVWGGGNNGSGAVNTISYITIATPSDTTDFGDLTTTKLNLSGGMSDNTYGVFNNGYNSNADMDYITIATTGNATDFGDMTTIRVATTSTDDASRGVNMGGQYNDVIDYITIATPGNATDFGDLVTGAIYASATSNSTRGVHSGGQDINSTYLNDIQYITIQTTGNASDFGDLVYTSWRRASTSG